MVQTSQVATLSRTPASNFRSASTQSVAADPQPEDTYSAGQTGWAIPFQNMTTLQKHLAFFDRNHDGQLTRSETAEGLRKLGLGPAKAQAVATLINVGIGLSSSDHWYDLTTVNLAKINNAKHGSDTGIIGTKGEFVPEKFKEMFDKFDTNRDGALNEKEINVMHKALHTSWIGDVASKGEFGLLMKIAGQDQAVGGTTTRVLTRERLQSFYDGSLFYQLAGEKVPS